MNFYCECAYKTTIETLEKDCKFWFAVDKDGKVVAYGSDRMTTPVYRAEHNGDDVTVYGYNDVEKWRNK